jgi:phosphoenolpyruvate phosphomutase
MEAHSGISAKIVQETGFKGIWASGLSMSAAMGVRDNNEASYTQVLEVLEHMSDATKIPILVDADTGYGNFNNARRLIRKLEARGIAGVCIEDKLFPKTNSLLENEPQPLADVAEFALKIRACKDHQSDPNFCVVARVESFIAKQGLKDAITRAEAYRKAGADAILIHSNKKEPSEILEFLKEWAHRHPIVIVPTNYYKAPTQQLHDAGANMVIWANHNLRASIAAMQKVSKQIHEDHNLLKVEENVVTVKEVFRLTDMEEMKKAEQRYFPMGGN